MKLTSTLTRPQKKNIDFVTYAKHLNLITNYANSTPMPILNKKSKSI